jgi:hypothetical protein
MMKLNKMPFLRIIANFQQKSIFLKFCAIMSALKDGLGFIYSLCFSCNASFKYNQSKEFSILYLQHFRNEVF